ncbi:MAG TPA: carboxypeptidase-like regulatory domain-containing protein [Gemmatimonadales bacterium]|nr:carboxypeptidase-like regulatory domain-containing protein [Gemmatimonadales bacterium]
MTLSPLVALALMASALQAPDDSTPRIRGKAGSAVNGRPLAGVTIAAIEFKKQEGTDSAVAEVQRAVVTDSTGLFWLKGLRAGSQAIRVTYAGEHVDDKFTLAEHGTLRLVILLDPARAGLGATIVEERQASVWRDLAGFYERRERYTGFARFITREEIDRIKPKRVSTLLTVEGISTRCGRQWCGPTRLNAGAICAVPVNVDGMPNQERDYDQIPVADLAAIEIYRGVPPVGLDVPLPGPPGPSIWQGGGKGTASTAGSCGLIMIWTR